jgi:ketosteroid isomerase-like protein
MTATLTGGVLTGDAAVELAQGLENQRARAVMARDLSALETLLADGLLYCHSTGLIEDKPAYLGKLAEGTATYHEYRSDVERATMPAADTVIASGRLHLDATVSGTLHEIRGRFLTIWRHDGYGWRMEAIQGVPG